MKYLGSFFVTHFFFTYAMIKLSGKSLDCSKKKFIMFFFIIYLLLILNFEYSSPTFRVIVNILIYIFYAYKTFNGKIKDSIILGLLTIVMGSFSEFIYVLLTYPLFQYNTVLEENITMSFINNLGVGIILIGICSLKFIKKLYEKILYSINKIDNKKIVIFSLLIVVFFNFASLISYCVSKELLDKYYLTFIGYFLCTFSSIIIYYYFKTQNKYLEVYEKYNISLESIRQFEIISQKFHIDSHENKNQLRTIRNMSKNKKVVSYIDALLNENPTDDEQLFMKTLQIPSGGLRGIIYTKLLEMKEKGIIFELSVDKMITNDLAQKIDEYTLTDICRILGVFLDNSIENVLNLSEQYIMVEMYAGEGELNIDITNNYEGYVDIEKISNPGETTKGDNHGYGLALVETLVKKNKKLFHESEIVENNFIQKLKIKV